MPERTLIPSGNAALVHLFGVLYYVIALGVRLDHFGHMEDGE